MTLEADLVSLLVGDPSIAAIINDQAANERRIYPLERPADQKNVPAIVYQTIFSEPLANLEHGDDAGAAGTGAERARIQLDIWGRTFDQANTLALLVRTRMDAGNSSIRSVRISRRSELDPDTKERREILEYSVWHSPQ